MSVVSRYTVSKVQQLFSLPGNQVPYLFVDADQFRVVDDEPFRSEMYAIALLKEGSFFMQTGLNKVLLQAPVLLTIGPSVIRRFTQTGNLPVAEVLFFTDQFFLEDQPNVFYMLQYDFFEDKGDHVLPLTGAQLTKYNRLFEQVKTLLEEKHLNEAGIMRSYVNILLQEADATYRQSGIATAAPTMGSNALLHHFKTLLSKEYMRQRSVGFYANTLHITPKHLSEYIKEQTGKTAGEWIDEAVILEAKVLLQHRDLSIAQVSDHLHFSDQSVFSKFFKTNAGMAPSEYRKRY